MQEQNEKQEEMKNEIKKYNWQQEGRQDLLASFLQSLFTKYEGDRHRINEALDRYKKDGTIEQLVAANKFDIKSMIEDKLSFICQLNDQFGGANINDLISMQIDEFKHK